MAKETKDQLLGKWEKAYKNIRNLQNNNLKKSEFVKILDKYGISLKNKNLQFYVQCGILECNGRRISITSEFRRDSNRDRMITAFMELRLEYSRKRAESSKTVEEVAEHDVAVEQEAAVEQIAETSRVSDDELVGLLDRMCDPTDDQLEYIASYMLDHGYSFIPDKTMFILATAGAKFVNAFKDFCIANN